MKNAFPAAAALLLLSACDDAFLATIPGTEQYEQAQAELAAWDGAVASVACQLVTEREYLAVELQTGLSRDRVVQIMSRKLADGEAQQLEAGGYRYVGGSCTPASQTASAPAAT